MSLIGFYLEVLQTFENNNVEYLIVGGHAVNYHGYVRATLDLDIWVNITSENLKKIQNSFVQLGYNEKSSTIAITYLEKNHIIKIPKEKAIIELMDSFIIKSDFGQASKKCETLKINNLNIKIIGFDDLINIKYNTNRPKDLIDVKELKTLKELRDNQGI